MGDARRFVGTPPEAGRYWSLASCARMPAHMLGAYLSYMITSLFVGSPAAFWIALVLASAGVAIAGALVEATFLRPVYRREELEQVLVTYALVLNHGVLAGGARRDSAGAHLRLPRGRHAPLPEPGDARGDG
jgi:ABC-type branched-subunit amino acid transport system permease subunit